MGRSAKEFASEDSVIYYLVYYFFHHRGDQPWRHIHFIAGMVLPLITPRCRWRNGQAILMRVTLLTS